MPGTQFSLRRDQYLTISDVAKIANCSVPTATTLLSVLVKPLETAPWGSDKRCAFPLNSGELVLQALQRKQAFSKPLLATAVSKTIEIKKYKHLPCSYDLAKKYSKSASYLERILTDQGIFPANREYGQQGIKRYIKRWGKDATDYLDNLSSGNKSVEQLISTQVGDVPVLERIYNLLVSKLKLGLVMQISARC